MTQHTARKLNIALKLALIVLLTALIALQVKTLNRLNESRTPKPVMSATIVTLPEALTTGMDAGINLPIARYSDNDLGPSGTPTCRVSGELDATTSDLINSDPGVDVGETLDASLTQ